MAWRHQMIADGKAELERLVGELARQPTGSKAASLKMEITGLTRLIRRLRGEAEGRVHEAAYPRVIN